MDLAERVIFFMIGGGMGFILGFVVARLKVIEEKVDHVKHEVHEVDVIVKDARKRDERGFMRVPFVADIAYLLALALILLGLWFMYDQSKSDREARVCNTEYLQSQAEFLSVVLAEPRSSPRERQRALQEYYQLLTAYANSDNEPTYAEINKFDISEEFKKCLTDEEKADG
jgi:hypothetical protein